MLRAFLALGLVGPLALAACGPQEESTDERTSYVALGDSYTSAPYIGEADGEDGCLRSKGNYPHLLAEKLDLLLTDVSCSGATTDSVFTEDATTTGKVRPQLDAVDSDVDLVTIGLGFNDFGLSLTVFGTCAQLAEDDSTGAPCTAADRTYTGDAIDSALEDVSTRLRNVVEKVARRAPHARIILIGYPSVFPERRTCPNLPIAAGDLPLVRRVLTSLDEGAKRIAKDLDLTFIDVAAATGGHDVCAAEPWIAGAANDPERGGAPWHPYAEEQAKIADLVQRSLLDDGS